MTQSTSSSPTRRTVVRGGVLVGLSGLAVASARGVASAAGVPTASARAALAASTACATLTPDLTQGPFWVDERLERSDIRPDSETGAVQDGIPLTLTLTLQDAGAACAPQAGAYVDVWHANAQGAYSDVSGSGNPDNRGVDWLRGYQVSDDAGQVTFTTVFPGWYVSRTVHVHFRVRVALADDSEVNFTSQLFFEESVDSAVVSTSAYRKSGTRTTNSTDGLYDASLVVPVTGSTSTGYAGGFTVNLDFEDGTDEDDGLVDARVVSAHVGRRRGRRQLRVVLERGEEVTTQVRLSRHDDVLAGRRTGWRAAGRSTLTAWVPRSVAAGRATVLVTVRDRAGNAKVVRRQVVLPRA